MAFACDADNDDVLAIAEEEGIFLNQAFFVLMFGILEHQINLLAAAKIPNARRDAMRGSAFATRLDSAIKVATEVLGDSHAVEIAKARDQIIDWYSSRNDMAHGEPRTRLLDIVSLLQGARMIFALLSKVQAAI
jgi:hypothetical protein